MTMVDNNPAGQRLAGIIHSMDSDKKFTLVELLTVVAIIGLLAAILLPALGIARRRGERIACVGQLRQIAVAVHGYANDWNSCLPVAARLGPEAALGLPSLPQVLAAELTATAVFRCPGDRLEPTYFDDFGTSYEWNTFLGGKQIDRATMRVVGMAISAPMLGDAEDFHHRDERNWLYIDGRVSQGLELIIQ